MTEPLSASQSDAASEPEAARESTLREAIVRLDEIGKDVRRQGRAAIAAQAASEQCLEAVEALGAQAAPDGSTATARAWLEAIIPTADAIDRIIALASSLAERQSPRKSFWPFGGQRRNVQDDPVMLEGLRVLRSQLLAALDAQGVSVERRTGIALDPSIHRVVEVRGRTGTETVVEIVRPGYLLDGQVVREAEVVVRNG